MPATATPTSAIQATALMPSPALRPYVRRFLVVENLQQRTNTLLPHAAVIAGFRFRGEAAKDGHSALRAVVTGLRDRPRVLTHSAGSGTVLAMFTALGAAAFVREPLEDIFNTSMPLDMQVRSSSLEILSEQLAEAENHTARVEKLEKFLVAELREHAPDPVVGVALAHIRASRGRVRIDALARETGLSQSALERRFRKSVGASPKKYANIVRMRHAVQLHTAGNSLTEAAYGAGYSDQSHFIKDFKRLAGLAPEIFFRTQTSFC